MTELRPLLESGDDLERALLQSVRADLPSGLGLRDTALALGLAGSTAESLAASLSAASSLSHASVPVSSAATATAATGTTAATTSVGASGALGAASLGVVGKSLVGGALVSFLALTTLDHSWRSPASERAQPAVRTAAAAVAQRAQDASPGSQLAAIPPVLPDTRPAPIATAAVASSAGHPSPSRLEPELAVAPNLDAPSNAAFALPARPEQPSGAAANASLAAEIRLLDQARAALAQGNSSQAAALLARYAANRPSPVLAQEAALLRVRLLLNQGDRASAAQLARRILREHPESAHVDWLRSLAVEP